jgi:hypothetical protein
MARRWWTGVVLVAAGCGRILGLDDVSGPPDASGVGSIVADRSTVELGEVDLGASGDAMVVLRNVGTREASITGATVSGAPALTIASNQCVGALAPGTTCSIAVEATPAVAGPLAETLTIETSSGSFQLPVQATGAARVEVTPTGPGRVTSEPAGVDCSGASTGGCTARFTVPDVVLHASDDVTVRWSGPCAGNGACALRLDDHRTVAAATFAPLRLVFNDDDNGHDRAFAVAAAPSNGFVVVGEVTNVARGSLAWMRSYAADGQVLWTSTYDGGGEGHDIAHDVSVLADGTAMIVGEWYSGSNSRFNWFMRRMPPSGTGPTDAAGESIGDDLLLGVAIDSEGHVLTAGYQPDTSGESQAWMAKATAFGSAVYTRNRDGSATGDDVAVEVVVDSADNAIFVGREQVTGQAQNAFVAAFAKNGAPLWMDSHDGPGHGADEALDAAIAPDDAVVVAGRQDDRAWIGIYASDGRVLAKTTQDEASIWRSVAVDAQGNLAVTGSKEGALVVSKYTRAGARIWTRSIADATGHGIAIDGAGNVIVAGEAEAPGNNGNVLVLKYTQ